MTTSPQTRPLAGPVRQLQDASGGLPAVPSEGERSREDSSRRRRRTRKRAAAAAVLAISLTSVIAAVSLWTADAQPTDGNYIYFTVRPMDLPITVTERGTLDSQNNVEVVCEVDDVHGDGILGTPILWLVENGASVEKGDLLVELDNTMHLERLDEQTLGTERAEARQIQAAISFENRKSLNKTALERARLKLELSELALRQYQDENGGTYQIELQEIEMAIQQRKARELIDRENEVGVKRLFDLGYKSKGDLDQAHLKALRARVALEREEARRRELREFTYVKEILELTERVELNKRKLAQVVENNKALLEQSRIFKESAERLLTREQERLARYREQCGKCKIYAPQSGLVAYKVTSSRGGRSTSVIAEGSPVRDKQPLLSLPDLTHMQVKTAIHESVVDRVKVGMTAFVRLDAFPDREYEGVVKSVAVLPDPGSWFNSDTKTYETIVTIQNDVQKAKPGMTAVAEMNIDYLTDVLCVPVQALIQRGKETWCYVAAGGKITQQTVELGQTNDKFVEVVAGLDKGDTVILNPTDIYDQQKGDEAIGPDEESSEDTAVQL